MRYKVLFSLLVVSFLQLIVGIVPSVAVGTAVDPGVPTLYWTFDSPSNFNREGVYRTDLDIRGVATYSTDGVIGGALSLESSTVSYLASDTGLANLPIADSHYTLSAWVKSRECDRGGILWWGPYAGWADVTALRVDNCGFVDYWFRDDNSVSVTGSFRDTWHFVSSVYDGSTKKLYVDGSLLATVSSGSPHQVTNEHFRIGNTFPASRDEYFTGLLDEVSIFGRALSAEEISYLMTNGISALPSPTPVESSPEIERLKIVNDCRRNLIVTVRSEATPTVNQFNCADFVNVNERSIIGINADISKLETKEIEDLSEISKIVQTHVTVDRVAMKKWFYFRELSEVGLVTFESKCKTMIMRMIRALPTEVIDTYAEIQAVVSKVEQQYLDRKARLTSILGRARA